MRILFLLPNNVLGGAEQYLKMIAEYYSNEVVEIVFLKKSNQTSLWDNLSQSTSQYFMSSKSESKGLLIFFLKILLKRNSYDYIFTSHISTNAFIGLMLTLRLLKTKKFIARESTTIFTRFKGKSLFRYSLLYKLGYRKIDLLICQTELMKTQLIEHFPQIIKRTKVEVIPNPINKVQIDVQSKMKASVDLPNEYIVGAGRLIELKGFDLLISSLAKLKNDYPNLKLVILGDGLLKDTLEQQADKLGIINDVIFAGHVNNVYPYFKNAKVCVVSSRIEGFPNVLLQMMSQNNNVISTTCAGGIKEIPNITTVETNNIESLYEGILNTLKNLNKSSINIHNDYLNKRDIKGFINCVHHSSN